MRYTRTALWGAALLGAVFLGFQSGRAQSEGEDTSWIIGVYGLGGIISEDGSLWQWMPDQRKWMTIDEVLGAEGMQTQILPLPVDVHDIRFMETWGFLVTHDGQVWHYSLNEQRWENVGTP
ncbi:MAG: hypothetical protein ACE5G2_09850 [Candidatus Krumholzibacteriia bacterium]